MVSLSGCAPGADGPSSARGAPRVGHVSASDRSAADQAADGPAPDAGFDASRRLRRPREFAAVLKSGASLRSRHFVLKHRANDGGGARIGLVVARRLLKRAVDRNLVKRIAREAFRAERWRLTSADLVLRLAVAPAGIDRRELRSEIDALLARLSR
jgi:ribonuclease P protein component